MADFPPVTRSTRGGDDPLLKAIRAGLGAAHDAGEHYKDDLTADHIAVVLDAHGMVLPVGVTIGLVYRVLFRSEPDGYQFTERRQAVHHAQFGGVCGRCGTVEQAWRVQADGVDVTTTWSRVND